MPASMGFPQSDMWESMLGVYPIEAEIDKRKLMYVHVYLRSESN
jgi:hypothetical protein